MPVVTTNKNDGESNESLVRRFVRKVQSSGKLNLVKQNKFRKTSQSKRLRRRSAIRRTTVRAEREYLRKIGRLEETTSRGYNKR